MDAVFIFACRNTIIQTGKDCYEITLEEKCPWQTAPSYKQEKTAFIF